MDARDLLDLTDQLRTLLGDDAVITDHQRLRTYECDGLAQYKVVPALVVLAGTTTHVATVVRACAAARVPFVARGSGTGLSGGALPHADGVLIVMSRMREVLEIDRANQRAVVEPGVINLQLSREALPQGYYYAPDPSSQQICSIGGNVAENSGGAHCLKYGFTTNHVTGLELVTPGGEVVQIGGKAIDAPGYDLLGAIVGSEGTLGIATKVTVRLTRTPEAVRTLLAAFPHTDQAGAAVSAIIGAGVIPAAFEIRIAADDAERALFWKGRKSAFAAVGRISPDYIVQDGVIPRTALPEVLRRIAAISDVAGVRVANVFHAGDGNLHPLVLFDAAVRGESDRAEQVSGAIVDLCIEYGGSITGEHGVGSDKAKYMPRMFSDDDLDTMQLVRCAFDPSSISNPGKIFPTPRLCGEVPGRHKGAHPLADAGLAEVF